MRSHCSKTLQKLTQKPAVRQNFTDVSNITQAQFCGRYGLTPWFIEYHNTLKDKGQSFEDKVQRESQEVAHFQWDQKINIQRINYVSIKHISTAAVHIKWCKNIGVDAIKLHRKRNGKIPSVHASILYTAYPSRVTERWNTTGRSLIYHRAHTETKNRSHSHSRSHSHLWAI